MDQRLSENDVAAICNHVIARSAELMASLSATPASVAAPREKLSVNKSSQHYPMGPRADLGDDV
jgi:hypothetical protein